MAIHNGTSHQINIYAQEDTYPVQGGRKLVLKEGATPLRVIPPGTNLNASSSVSREEEEEGIPTKEMTFDSVDNPYIFFWGSTLEDKFIVSNQYRAAAREVGSDVPVGKFRTVGGTVYSDESSTRPCGCLYLLRG